MIPYDDLVAALSAWRARQGLPVNQAGSGSGPTATPGSGPNKTGSGPNKAPPPAPPSSSRPNIPVAAAEEPMEVAEELLDEEAAYENEGNDFAMSFGQQGANADATAIGEAPERPTEADLGNDKDDW